LALGEAKPVLPAFVVDEGRFWYFGTGSGLVKAAGRPLDTDSGMFTESLLFIFCDCTVGYPGVGLAIPEIF